MNVMLYIVPKCNFIREIDLLIVSNFMHAMQVIAEQHPRSLLILDDVWSYEVINAFSVRCRLLVTTRVSALISPVMVKNVNSVSVSEGEFRN